MRDIGTRIQRYRLSRYGSPAGTVLRRLRWALPLLGLWLVYVSLFSDHSLLRMWRLSRDGAEAQKRLESTRKELAQLESDMNNPATRRRQGEQLLREKSGYARREETIYRIPPAEAESLAK
jgi:cell division protein FtsB